MADNKLELEIVAPDQRVLAAEVDEVVLPGTEGYLGVRPGHAPLLTALQVGEISYRQDGRQHLLAVSGGFAEIQRDRVTVLATSSEPAERIDVERARTALERAQGRLAAQPEELERRRADMALKRATNRIHIHERHQSMMV